MTREVVMISICVGDWRQGGEGMHKTIMLGLLLAYGAIANGADDPASRLRGARSLAARIPQAP
jgi:hypothetical protein